MVLEQFIKTQWLERKEHSFFLGIAYTIIGIVSAYLILPSYAGILSIAFTSILLIPSLNILLQEEENIEVREKKFSIPLLIKDHLDIIRVYLFLFMGIFVTYFGCAMLLGSETVMFLFKEQLTLTGLIGNATSSAHFFGILNNNIIVFAVAFILSFFYGAGAIIFLTINASVWGTYFGYVFKTTLFATENGGFSALMIKVASILPHTMTEAMAYILAAIVGGIVSKAVLREKFLSREFNHIITDALLFLAIGFFCVIIAAILEVYVF